MRRGAFAAAPNFSFMNSVNAPVSGPKFSFTPITINFTGNGNLSTMRTQSFSVVIHIDVDPSSISKNVHVDVPVVGDARYILSELAKLVESRDRKAWFDRIAEWKSKFPFRYDRDKGQLKPQYVIEEVCRQTNSEAVVTTGVGQHQMWAAQFYRYVRPRQFITSGGLGTMGYGLPAAIGAQIAMPDETVVDIDGDHSFNMTMTELSTAVQYELPVKVVLLNNGYMGMVRQWQELFYGRRYASSFLSNPDYARLADALGAVGITAEKKEDVPGAVEQMLAETRPCVVDFRIEPEENVWPMVPSGRSLDEMDGLDILESMA
jgi:acetolactate synthase-1/2/3 large subunit